MRTKKTYIVMAIAIISAITFLVSAIILTAQFFDSKQSAQTFEQLEQIVLDGEQEERNEAQETPITAYEQYIKLHELNDDFVGWVSIEDTQLSYPVMQTVESPNFYLKHNFEGEYSDYGVPYVDEKCGIDLSNNTIIYGHSMTDGSMFDALLKYADEDFCKENPVIRFDTLSGYGEYEILAVFKVDVSTDPFFYTTYTDMDEEQFDEYIEQVTAHAFYDTGVTAEYGDMLLTLSTCEYTLEDGRFVVVAKKI